MVKKTKQHCPHCGCIYDEEKGWYEPTTSEIITINAEVKAGMTQIMEFSCIFCDQAGYDGVGHC